MPVMTDENAADAGRAARIPVVVITGFLGSGKTTVLNHLVKQPGMQSTAVIINEFGEIGIDHLLVETSSEMMMELNNGCICCTIRGDLADKLGSLAMWLDVGRIQAVERVVVETTGLADPAPIMHTLMVEQDLLARYRLDRVITVVDAITATAALDRFPEATKQVAMADVLLLAKTDLVQRHSNAGQYAELLARLRALNPQARVHETVGGVVDPQLIFGPPSDGVDANFATLAAGRAVDAAVRLPAGAPVSGDRDAGVQRHDYRSAGIGSFVVELQNPVDPERFDALLRGLAADFGGQLLRTKGIVHVAGVPERPAVVHGVQHVFFPVSWLDRWPDDDRSSRLVFITQGLAPNVIRDRIREHFS
ncbi:MAG: GTP-binding protein [Burkholderiales bacterium]|nr:GTP-binding protein [Burkholderiales bacterium]